MKTVLGKTGVSVRHVTTRVGALKAPASWKEFQHLVRALRHGRVGLLKSATDQLAKGASNPLAVAVELRKGELPPGRGAGALQGPRARRAAPPSRPVRTRTSCRAARTPHAGPTLARVDERFADHLSHPRHRGADRRDMTARPVAPPATGPDLGPRRGRPGRAGHVRRVRLRRRHCRAARPSSSSTAAMSSKPRRSGPTTSRRSSAA